MLLKPSAGSVVAFSTPALGDPREPLEASVGYRPLFPEPLLPRHMQAWRLCLLPTAPGAPWPCPDLVRGPSQTVDWEVPWSLLLRAVLYKRLLL